MAASLPIPNYVRGLLAGLRLYTTSLIGSEFLGDEWEFRLDTPIRLSSAIIEDWPCGSTIGWRRGTMGATRSGMRNPIGKLLKTFFRRQDARAELPLKNVVLVIPSAPVF